jgi:hypothetical protein
MARPIPDARLRALFGEPPARAPARRLADAIETGAVAAATFAAAWFLAALVMALPR